MSRLRLETHNKIIGYQILFWNVHLPPWLCQPYNYNFTSLLPTSLHRHITHIYTKTIVEPLVATNASTQTLHMQILPTNLPYRKHKLRL